MNISSEWTDQTKPLYAELVPLVANGYDVEIAEVLNRRDRSGYITRRHIVSTLARFPMVLGLVRWVIDSRTMPDGSAVSFENYCLFTAIWLVVENDEGLKTSVTELVAGLNQLPEELVPSNFATELLAGEIKISRAEEIFNREIQANEIEHARKGN